MFFLLTFSSLVFAQDSGFYSFKVKTLDGGEFDFSTLKGKKVMIVNTASKCGFTPQYKELEEVYEQYKGNLVIIGEPGTRISIGDQKILHRKLRCHISHDGKNIG